MDSEWDRQAISMGHLLPRAQGREVGNSLLNVLVEGHNSSAL